MPRLFVAAPKRAELPWVQGRLDPDHPGNGHVLTTYGTLLQRIDPAKVLVPDDPDWLAGELDGRVARALAGGGGKITTAFDRFELISDALTAILAGRVGHPSDILEKACAVLGRHVRAVADYRAR